MHPLAGNQQFIKSSLDALVQNLNEGSVEVRNAVAEAISTSDPALVEAERSRLASHFASIRDLTAGEQSHRDVDYVSRFNLVGLYQSVLSTVFGSIPSLQGYGDRNPIWIVTLVEQGVYALGKEPSSADRQALNPQTWADPMLTRGALAIHPRSGQRVWVDGRLLLQAFSLATRSGR